MPSRAALGNATSPPKELPEISHAKISIGRSRPDQFRETCCRAPLHGASVAEPCVVSCPAGPEGPVMPGNDADAPTPRRGHFGPVVFDVRTLAVSLVHMLQYLLEHAGTVIHKDALMRAVWPGRIVSDAALSKCLARLRDTIGDREQVLISTHHGFGYRFLAQVDIETFASDRLPEPERVGTMTRSEMPAQISDERAPVLRSPLTTHRLSGATSGSIFSFTFEQPRNRNIRVGPH